MPIKRQIASRRQIRVATVVSLACLIGVFLREAQIFQLFENPQTASKLSLTSPQGNKQPLQSYDFVKEQPFPFLKQAPIGKDLIVHSAVYDSRARNGYFNTTVIFLSVEASIMNSNRITGCGVGSRKAKSHSVRSVAEALKMQEWLGESFFKYKNIVMECYDLPAIDGDGVFVIYKVSENSSLEFVVESQQPLIVPAPRVTPTGRHNFTVVTCTKVHNKKAAFFPEYIKYQKTIGVDHVHVSIPDTFVMDGGLQHHLIAEPFLRKALREGYLTFSLFKNWYNDSNQEVFVHSESLRKLECIYRFRGTYDYAFPLDTDDFFNPRVPGKSQLKDYIRDYCYEKPAASCMFKWYYYYPLLCGMKGKVGEDGNVTRQLKSHRANYFQNNVKSVHNTNALVDCTFHHAECKECLLPGYTVARVSPREAYIAHNRLDYEERTLEDAC